MFPSFGLPRAAIILTAGIVALAPANIARGNLTEEDRAMLKALNSTVSVKFVKQPLGDVIEFLHDRTGQTIVVDPAALKRLKLDHSTPVTLEAKKIPVRVALKKLLGDLALAYIDKNGIIQVVSPQVAQNSLTTRSYYIGDLLPLPPGANPAAHAARLKWLARGVIHKIADTIEPDSWQASGHGPGTLSYNPATRSIVVHNSGEVQLFVEASLSGK